MQADAEHVRAEEGPGGDGVAEDRHGNQPALADDSAPAGVQDCGVPNDDHHRAVFLGIPAPKPAPRLIRPNAAEHRPNKAEKRGKTDDAVDHLGARRTVGFVERNLVGDEVAHDINDREKAGDEGCRVADGDNDHVCREPEVGVEHRLQHFHRVAAKREPSGDEQRDEAHRAGDDVADAIAINTLQN